MPLVPFGYLVGTVAYISGGAATVVQITTGSQSSFDGTTVTCQSSVGTATVAPVVGTFDLLTLDPVPAFSVY